MRSVVGSESPLQMDIIIVVTTPCLAHQMWFQVEQTVKLLFTFE